MDRRNFIKKTSILGTGLTLTPIVVSKVLEEKKVFNQCIDKFKVSFCSRGKIIGVYLVKPNYEKDGIYNLNIEKGLKNGGIIQIRG